MGEDEGGMKTEVLSVAWVVATLDVVPFKGRLADMDVGAGVELEDVRVAAEVVNFTGPPGLTDNVDAREVVEIDI
jgi:hypothetical protein